MKFVALGIFLCLVGHAGAEEYKTPPDYSGAYLCKLNAAGGVRKNSATGKWEAATFNVSDVAYVLKLTSTGKTQPDDTTRTNRRIYSMTVRDFDPSAKPRQCRSLRGSAQRDEIEVWNSRVICRFFGTEFNVDFEALRIQTTFDGGYMSDDADTDTPYVAVGTCAKVD